jgi:molecular chaperone DnaK
MFEDLRPEVAGQPPRVTVQFDFDVNGMLHVSAVDRGSGKQARMSFKAARARLSPAEMARTRADLEALEQVALDEDSATEEAETFHIDALQGNMEVVGLLARARRALERSSGVTSADLQTAIAQLEETARRGGPEAVEEKAEALLDLLYELEDEE